MLTCLVGGDEVGKKLAYLLSCLVLGARSSSSSCCCCCCYF